VRPDMEDLRKNNHRKNVFLGVVLFLAGIGGITWVFKWPAAIWWDLRYLVTLLFSYLLGWVGLFQIRDGLGDGRKGPWFSVAGLGGLFLGAVLIVGLVLLAFIYVQGAMKPLG